MPGNGNGFSYKWMAGGLATLVVLVCSGYMAMVNDTIANTSQMVKDHEKRLNKQEVERALMALQLAEFAKVLRVPVIVDTANATDILLLDSMRREIP